MNAHDPNAPDRDELKDRLIDGALRELLGGEQPPDLCDRILTAAASSAAPTTEALNGVKTMSEKPPRRSKFTVAWGAFAVAATLLLAAGWMMLPQIQATREAASRSPQSLPQPTHLNSSPSVDDKGSTQPSNYYLSDDVRYATPDDELKMMVTPHVIGQPEELGKVLDGTRNTSELSQEGAGQNAAAPLQLGVEVNSEAVQALQKATTGKADSIGSTYQYGDGRSAQRWEDSASKNKATVANSDPTSRYWGYQGTKNAAFPYEASDLPYKQESFGMTGSPDAKANIASTEYESVKSEHLIKKVREAQSQHQLGWRRLYQEQHNRDQYVRIHDNPFLTVSTADTNNRLSTFSIDVDTASYANVRQFLLQSGTLPPPDAVRIEELLNYFDYDYAPPTGDVPFASNVEVAQCPWQPEHRLVRIGIKGREIERTARPKSNLVFLVDVSGSMDEPNKLPLLLEGMRMLTRELGENDLVAIVVYASSEGLALASTRGDQHDKILGALDQLSAGGSTAGGAGIQLAYQTAVDNFVKGGVNRVILCTDGDFNVGVTSPAELERMAETKAKETGVFLTVLGFGRGNLNDAMMEQIADKGNGNYHYVDTQKEARKVLVDEMSGTLVTIAKDVKIQVEFNPAKVAGYRLIGYENRVMAAEDFNDDKKDAGEIGAGHTVTALYEVVPVGVKVEAAGVDDLKYGEVASATGSAEENVADAKTPSDDLLTLKIRYKQPDGDVSKKLEFPIADNEQPFAKASMDFQFAASVASFGMLLRNSEHKGNATLASVAEIAQAANNRGVVHHYALTDPQAITDLVKAASGNPDLYGYRKEFVEMVNRAAELAGQPHLAPGQ